MSVDKLRLRLPVDLGWAGDGTVVAGRRDRARSDSTARRWQARSCRRPRPRSAFVGDSVTLVGGLHLPVFGGEVVLEDVGLAELAQSSRHLTTSVGLVGISLTEVAQALGLPPLEGDVAGRFPACGSATESWQWTEPASCRSSAAR